MKKFLWPACIFLMLGSCLDEPNCVNMNNGFIGISFKKMFDGKADTVAFVEVRSPVSDSVFYQFSLTTEIRLPLNQYTTQTRYTLEEVYDENFLVMDYVSSSVQFISGDCGTRYILSNLEFTDHDFDSLEIITNTLSGSVQTNLEIYRCPRTNLAKVAFRQMIGTTERADTVHLNNVSADFPATFFIPNDTLSYINLPLNQNSPTTTFYFDFKDGPSRTITFNYIRTPWNEFDAQCGSLTLFSDLSSTIYDFTTVQIRKDSVQDPPLTNVAIFK